LNRLGLRIGALIVNRVMPALPDIRELQRSSLPAGLKRRLERNLVDFKALKARETASLRSLRELRSAAPTLTAADLGGEPADLRDLIRIAQSLRPAD
jgi:hypothetical protein